MKKKVKVKEKEIYEKYLKDEKDKNRGVVEKIGKIVDKIERECKKKKMKKRECFKVWSEIMKVEIEEMKKMIKEEGVVYEYEMNSSGMVKELMYMM
jgi:hypothetical protein